MMQDVFSVLDFLFTQFYLQKNKLLKTSEADSISEHTVHFEMILFKAENSG